MAIQVWDGSRYADARLPYAGHSGIPKAVHAWDGQGMAQVWPRERLGLAPARYWDVLPILEALDHDAQIGDSPEGAAFLSAYNINISVMYNSSIIGAVGQFRTRDIPRGHPNVRWMLKLMVSETAKYPPAVIRESSLRHFFLTGDMIDRNDPGVQWRGLALPDRFYMTIWAGDIDSAPFTVHHEIQHTFMGKHQAYFDSIRDEWVANNSEPYIGVSWRERDPEVRPVGFTHNYGLESYREDLAEVFGALMTTSQMNRLRPLLRSDPGLTRKMEMMTEWMATLSPETARPDYFDAIHAEGPHVFAEPRPLWRDDPQPPFPPNGNPDAEVVAITGTTGTESRDQLLAALAARGFTNHARILRLPFLLDTSQATSLHGLFSGFSALVEAPEMDTSGVTNMREMFDGCKMLYDGPSMDTGNVTDMAYMFRECDFLTVSPDMDTSNVTSMLGMFENCGVLRTVSPMDTANVVTMESMFYGCRMLSKVADLNTGNVTDFYRMFHSCSALRDGQVRLFGKLPTARVSSITLYSGLTRAPFYNADGNPV